MDGWNTCFLLGWPMFSHYLSFWDGNFGKKQIAADFLRRETHTLRKTNITMDLFFLSRCIDPIGSMYGIFTI